MVERALFLSSPEHLECVPGEYERLYFGVESCQDRLPSLEDIELVFDAASQRSWPLTFVTPWVTDRGIRALRPIFDFLARQAARPQIVVNDWGVWRVACAEYGFSDFALGRLLAQQRRDPCWSRMLRFMPRRQIDIVREAVVDAPGMIDFWREHKITRIELDNLRQGISRREPALPASLYMPYVFVSTTKFCPFACALGKNAVARTEGVCTKECMETAYRLRHRTMALPLFFYGNTYYFRNETIPGFLDELNVDRIVWQPEIVL